MTCEIKTEFAGGQITVVFDGKRTVKVPGDIVRDIKAMYSGESRIDHESASGVLIKYYRDSDFLIAGPDGCQYSQWEKERGNPYGCEPYLTAVEFVELCEALSGRDLTLVRSLVYGTTSHIVSKPFVRWRRLREGAL